MPKEIKSKSEFGELVKAATEVRVLRSGESAKVKLRTKNALYTLKTTPAEADALVKGLKIPVEEV